MATKGPNPLSFSCFGYFHAPELGHAEFSDLCFRCVSFLASSSLYYICACDRFVYVVLYICTGLYACTDIMQCILCSNDCNSVNDMIFVHVLVLTMQVPMYSLRGFCPLPGWLPNCSRPCTLLGFMVTTESALRPRAYFSPYWLTHSFRASHSIWMVIEV